MIYLLEHIFLDNDCYLRQDVIGAFTTISSLRENVDKLILSKTYDTLSYTVVNLDSIFVRSYYINSKWAYFSSQANCKYDWCDDEIGNKIPPKQDMDRNLVEDDNV
jgi:hypothetical protein